MYKPFAATAVAFALLISVAASVANAAPTYGLSTSAAVTNPFQAEDR